MSRLAQVGRRERTGAGGELSPGRFIGAWFAFLRPSRLLKLLGGCAVLLAIIYAIEFRSAAEAARTEAGAGASAERIEALTIARLALTRCSGPRGSCGVVPGKQTLYRHFGLAGTAAILVLAGAGLFLIGWGLGRRRSGIGI
jgi:hypothetical protein